MCASVLVFIIINNITTSKISAIKSKHVVTLGIDDSYGEAVAGPRRSPTYTSSALFIGGHPSLFKKSRVAGAISTQGFSGCIKNINVRNANFAKIPLKSAHGDVHIGMCPTD